MGLLREEFLLEIFFFFYLMKESFKKEVTEFPLWHNPISGVSGALRRRLNPLSLAWHNGLRIQLGCSCGAGHNCSSNLIPGPGTPSALGQAKQTNKQNKTKQNKNTVKKKVGRKLKGRKFPL